MGTPWCRAMDKDELSRGKGNTQRKSGERQRDGERERQRQRQKQGDGDLETWSRRGMKRWRWRRRRVEGGNETQVKKFSTFPVVQQSQAVCAWPASFALV